MLKKSSPISIPLPDTHTHFCKLKRDDDARTLTTCASLDPIDYTIYVILSFLAFYFIFCCFLFVLFPFFRLVVFVFCFFVPSLELLCRCSVDLFLSNTQTTYRIGNRILYCWVWLRPDRLMNIKTAHTPPPPRKPRTMVRVEADGQIYKQVQSFPYLGGAVTETPDMPV